MTGDEVRAVFEQMLPQEARHHLCQQCGVIERPRQLHLGMLVRAMVISAGTPGGADQADVLRASLESEGPRVPRAACARWFDEPLARFMEALAQRALASARAQPVDLPGPLSGVKEWSIVDSTTIQVRDALREEVPGTGDDAALKGHTSLSVGCGAPVRYHVRPARDHDSPHLQSDDAWRGDRLLADLARGQVTQAFVPGTAWEGLREEETLVLDGRAIDAEVQVGGTATPLHVRLVGIQTPQGDGVFRTHRPPRIGPLQVADRYRVRWEVALRSKLDTSVHRLDQIAAERPCALKTRRQASLMASPMAAVLAHRHHLNTRPQAAGAPRLEAPLHTRLLALHMAVSGQFIAQACELTGTAAKRRWDKIAARLTHAGTDPTWRHRPSVLDP